MRYFYTQDTYVSVIRNTGGGAERLVEQAGTSQTAVEGLEDQSRSCRWASKDEGGEDIYSIRNIYQVAIGTCTATPAHSQSST